MHETTPTASNRNKLIAGTGAVIVLVLLVVAVVVLFGRGRSAEAVVAEAQGRVIPTSSSTSLDASGGTPSTEANADTPSTDPATPANPDAGSATTPGGATNPNTNTGGNTNPGGGNTSGGGGGKTNPTPTNPSPTNPPAPQPTTPPKPVTPGPVVNSVSAPAAHSCSEGPYQGSNQITLSWTTSNAKSVNVAIDSPGGVYASGLPANGSTTVPGPCKGDTQTYYVIAIGADGKTATKSAVTVGK